MKRQLSDSFPGFLGEARVASTAGGGTALTSTAAVIGLPNGTTHVGLIARNFGTATVVKYALNPYLCLLKSTDFAQTATDYSAQGQQPGGTGVTLDALSTLNNGHALYIGSHVPFRGVNIVMSASVNAVVSVLTVEYWNGTGWVSAAPTDGTASGGATFAQNGNVTWTVPTAWAKGLLSNVRRIPFAGHPAQNAVVVPYNEIPRYWTRWSVNAALSATVLVNTMFALNRNTTAYSELVQDSQVQFRTIKGVGGHGCVEALTDASTANMIVNVYTDNPMGSF